MYILQPLVDDGPLIGMGICAPDASNGGSSRAPAHHMHAGFPAQSGLVHAAGRFAVTMLQHPCKQGSWLKCRRCCKNPLFVLACVMCDCAYMRVGFLSVHRALVVCKCVCMWKD